MRVCEAKIHRTQSLIDNARLNIGHTPAKIPQRSRASTDLLQPLAIKRTSTSTLYTNISKKSIVFCKNIIFFKNKFTQIWFSFFVHFTHNPADDYFSKSSKKFTVNSYICVIIA